MFAGVSGFSSRASVGTRNADLQHYPTASGEAPRSLRRRQMVNWSAGENMRRIARCAAMIPVTVTAAVSIYPTIT